MGGDSGSSRGWRRRERTRCSACISRARPWSRPSIALACLRDAGLREARHQPRRRTSRSVLASREQVALGYGPEFLPDTRVELAEALQEVEADYAPTASNGIVRDYTHFSLAMSSSRRFCRWVAWNVDGNGLIQLPAQPSGLSSTASTTRDVQVDDDLYRTTGSTAGTSPAAPICCGARATRPSRPTPTRSSSPTSPRSSTTSTSPPARPVGAARGRDLRGRRRRDLRVSVFGGPIFKEDRPLYRDVLVPASVLEADRLRRGRDAEGEGLRPHPGRPRGQARVARAGHVQPLPGRAGRPRRA